ncbi:hypothetical protein KC338_g342 [Hortaea werneckii]|nr:hypothetical protein KC338_g342 [Hortaea werneckii]
MVIVRESPRAKLSPDKPQSQAQWPPKSPFQALLSSPSGRKRWQDRRGQARDRSLSPSPIKNSSRKLQAVAMPSDDEMDMGGGADVDEEDDDDEETLRLKMEAIQARLKLKALQKKKKAEAGAEAGTSAGADRERTRSRASRDTTPPPSRGHRPSASQPDLYRAPNVEVEVSPIKDHHEDPLLSPARRRLGLNSVPDASGISLKRARDGTVTQQIKRSESALAPPSARRSRDASPPKKKTKSFTERLQASRDQVEEREAKFDRMERTRSKGFSSDVSRQTPFQSTKQKLEGASRGDAGTPSEAKRPLSARDGASSTAMPRPTVRGSQPSEPSSTYKGTPARFSAQAHSRAKPSKVNDTARPTSRGQQQQRLHTSADSDSDLSISGAPDSHRPKSARRADHDNSKDESNSSYDPFSELHLSKRHIPHPVVAREMNGKEIYPLPRLLKEVKAPHYDPPDCAEDFVVFGILASKSSPYDQKPQHKTTSSTSGGGGGETSQEDPLPPPTAAEEALPRNKFMVLHLTDLKWELDCFLFGTAFDQFWKLVPGTLLAILNPAILPPKKPNTDTGRFSLKLGSSDDCIMEVGSARDLGFCTATRRDGRECGGWVDRRRTEVCEFHLNAFVERQRKGRMEVNTMWRGQGNEGGSGGGGAGWMKNGNVRSQAREAGGWNRDMQRKRGGGGGGMQSHHREYGTLYSVPPGGGGRNGTGDSAASLLDAEDKLHLDSYEAGEASRKRIAAAQRERDLQRRLGAMGKGVGAEYMQASLEGGGTPIVEKGKGSDSLSSDQQQQQQHFEKPSAADLGLLGKQADAAHLSPAKDRRRHFGLGGAGMNSTTTSTTGRQGTGLGWGGARKAGLLLEQQQQQRGSSNDNESNDVGRNPPPSAVRRRRSTHDDMANGSPSKKRARFMLEDKGLREPGRDSGANELLRMGRNGGGGGGKGRAGDNEDDDDDDDGLEIV